MSNLMDTKQLTVAIDILAANLKRQERNVVQYSEHESADSNFNEGLDWGLDALDFLKKLVETGGE